MMRAGIAIDKESVHKPAGERGMPVTSCIRRVRSIDHFSIIGDSSPDKHPDRSGEPLGSPLFNLGLSAGHFDSVLVDWCDELVWP